MVSVEGQVQEENKKGWGQLDHCGRVSVHPAFTRVYFVCSQEHGFLRHQTSGHFATSMNRENLSHLKSILLHFLDFVLI